LIGRCPVTALGSSAIGILVEYMERFTVLLHLARRAAYGDLARIKNGPALVVMVQKQFATRSPAHYHLARADSIIPEPGLETTLRN
jgi:hypothetical protein